MTFRTVGELITKAKIEKCGDSKYPVLSMTMHDGIVFQDERFKKQIASIDQSTYNVVHRNQLVVSFPIDEGVLAVQDITDAGIVSPAYKIWDVDQAEVIPKYLEMFLRSPHSIQYYKSKLRGSTARRRSITDADLLGMEIPLGTKDEQTSILNILEHTKRLINIRKQELAKLDELIKARFVEMFGGEKNLMAMSDICSIITDGTHQPPKFKEDGIPFIFVSNITSDKLTYEAEKFIDQDTYNELVKRTPIEIGDVLLSTVGSYGHPAVVKSDKKFLFQRHIAYLKPKKEIVDSDYLHGAILSPGAQRQIEQGVKGIAQKTLNLSEIKKMRIPIPNMDKQKEFATFVAQVDKSKSRKELNYKTKKILAS